MIDEETVLLLKIWFDEYVNTFYSTNFEYQRNIDLKAEHTKCVCKEILNIGKSLNLTKQDLCLAEIMALFHDIGRFEQYARYDTFSDAKSKNHALLGVKILKKTGVLNQFIKDNAVCDLIIRVISYHNRAYIPEKETDKCLFFSKLLRDADKLDIWRVVIEYYYRKDRTKNKAVELDLPDNPDVSDKICNALLSEKIAKTKDIKTLNDFKLLQMGWVYDINFTKTFQIIKQRHYIEKIFETVPQTEKTLNIYYKIYSYLDKKINLLQDIKVKK